MTQDKAQETAKAKRDARKAGQTAPDPLLAEGADVVQTDAASVPDQPAADLPAPDATGPAAAADALPDAAQSDDILPSDDLPELPAGPIAAASVDQARDLPPNDIDADLARAPLTMPDPAQPAKRGGALPLVLGGAIAAALGFGAGSYLQSGSLWPQTAQSGDLADRLAAQELSLAALSERLDSAPAAPDVTPLSREIADLRADLVAATDALRPELAALAARLDALEAAPPATGEGSVDTAALDSLTADWESQIAALRGALETQNSRISQIASEANARIDAATAEIAGIGAAATTAAEAMARRGAMARVLAALESGAPYGEVLSEVVGDAVMPPMLASLAESGVPTLPQLQMQFPEAARAALATARAEGLAGEQGGFTGFLRSQFDVRSTSERAGEDPDAILSRAEARLSEYDLEAALAEIATLPEVVRAAMGGWLTLADSRTAALAEAESLAAALTDN